MRLRESRSVMSEEDVSKPPADDGREDKDVGTVAESGSGGLDEADRPGMRTGDESARDVDESNRSSARPTSEAGSERKARTSSSRDGDTHRAPPGSAVSQASSRSKRERKKKGRGGGAHTGEPAMSVEDLFVTISTVQVWVHAVLCRSRAFASCCAVL